MDNGLMSAQTGVQIIKAVGKRYSGFFGVAVAVISFVDCMSHY